MNSTFADSLKALREVRGLSQQQLANRLFVDRSTIAHWEAGDRIPDLAIVPRIAECLQVDLNALFAAPQEDATCHVIVLDDEPIALEGALRAVRSVLPETITMGFVRPSDALTYAKAHPVTLALLDIELGRTSGLDLCRELLAIKPRTNVVFLTAYREYSLDAWGTGACGFLLKPVTEAVLRTQLASLRYPTAALLAALQETSPRPQASSA